MTKYTLITGASSGIGSKIAIQLSEKYPLILCGRNEEKINKVLDLCNSKFNHLKMICDLSRLDTIKDALQLSLAGGGTPCIPSYTALDL